MDINLEKIELVKDRTGASYNEAKEALEKAEGSVVDAIIDIEQKNDSSFDENSTVGMANNAVFQKMKAIVEKGNISKIVIKKDDKTVVNFPVTVGVAGAIIVPWVVIVGITAAIGTKCVITFIDENGAEIDLNGKVVGLYDKTKEAVGDFASGDKVVQAKAAGQKAVDKGKEAVEKGKEAWAEFSKEGGTLEKMSDYTFKAYDKIQDIAEAGQSKVEAAYGKLEAAYNKANEDGKVDELKDKAEEVANKAVEAFESIKEVLKKYDKNAAAEAEDAEAEEACDAEDFAEEAAEAACEAAAEEAPCEAPAEE